MYFSSSVYSYPITDAAKFFSQKDKKPAQSLSLSSESLPKMKATPSMAKEKPNSN